MSATQVLSRLMILGLGLAAVGNAAAQEPRGEPWNCHIIDNSSRGADGVKLGDFDGDGRFDIATGWEQGGVTRVCRHPGPALVKSAWPSVTVGVTPSAEDALFVDLDRDGALDVVSCCEGSDERAAPGTRRIHLHWAPRQLGDYLKAEHWQQSSLALPRRWMFAQPMQVDGRNGVDLIAGSKRQQAEIGWWEVPDDARDVSQYRWHPISPAGWVMSIWPRDMDGDQDLDVVVSDRFGSLRGCRWLENPGVGPEQTKPWQNHFMGPRDDEVLSMALGDLDGDGLEDAVVAVKSMRLWFIRRLDAQGLRWQTHTIAADPTAGNPRAVAIVDVNADGRLDLVYTTWNADQKHGVLWLEFRQSPTDPQWVSHQISGKQAGIKYDRIEMLDLDEDGDLDVLTCEESENEVGLGVIWYENPHVASSP